VSAATGSVFPLGPAFAGRRYALLGLARSGLATVRALLAAGAEVVAWDSNEAARAELLRLVSPLPLAGRAGGGRETAMPVQAHPNPSRKREGLELVDLETIDLTGFDGLILSPGVPLNTHPLAAAARAAGVPIIGDIELFAQARAHLPPHKVVGITGTNGKSTTTALVHHILKTAGVPTLMGGNIGLPILSQQPLPEGGVYVLELSSYQIDLTFSLDCDVAVLLNVTPDHLDRYDGGFEAYRRSKLRLFEMQGKRHCVVVGIHADDMPQGMRDMFDAYPTLNVFWTSHDGSGAAQTHWPTLQGPHNRQNAAAASAAFRALDVEQSIIDRACASYPGLPHRMERIATVNGVQFINDSKATNPEAAAPALAAYTNIHWILGGLAKGATLGDCAQHYANVAHAYLIGAAAADFARAIGDAIPTTFSGDLETALTQASANAQPGDVVLLSPAAASFDQFRDFEARGDAFRDWVNAYAKGERA
jgi:UDP-N-acetylmuramoylalanine--D-glutamate ligase